MGEMKYENQLFLLSEIGSLDDVMKAVETQFGLEYGNGGNSFHLTNEDVAIEVAVLSEDMGDQAAENLKKQKHGIIGHFYGVETENTDVKTNAILQMFDAKSMMYVKYVFDDENREMKKDMIFNQFFAMLNPLKAVLLVVGDHEGEDALYVTDEEGRRKLLLSDTGESSFEEYMKKREVFFFEDAPIEAIERRKRTLKILDEYYLGLPSRYPYVEPEGHAKCRTTEEIAKRAVALLVVSLYSECLLGEHMTVEEATKYVSGVKKRFQITDDFFSPKELEYLKDPEPEEETAGQFSWQYENLFVCEWALGLINELPFPDAICDVPLTVRVLNEFDSLEDLISKSQRRTDSELIDADDLIYCLDWSCVETRIRNLPTLAAMDGGVVMERHKTLNWLIGAYDGAKWDEVGTDT